MSLLSPARRDQPALRRSIPWTADDLVRWMAASALSGVLVVVGWYLAAGQASDSRQISPLNVAIAGAVLGGLVNLMWLLRGWQALGARRKALVQQLPADERATRPDRGPDAQTEPGSAGVGLLVGEGSRYFHRPSCPLAVGRSWSAAPLPAHLSAGREPCGVCRP